MNAILFGLLFLARANAGLAAGDGLGASCYGAGTTIAERDAACADSLVCARAGFDSRDFGDCGNHHCCSNPQGTGTGTGTGTGLCNGREVCEEATFGDQSSTACTAVYACKSATFKGTAVATCSGTWACEYAKFEGAAVATCSGSEACRSADFEGAAVATCSTSNACYSATFKGKAVATCSTSIACRRATFEGAAVATCSATQACYETTWLEDACCKGNACPDQAPSCRNTDDAIDIVVIVVPVVVGIGCLAACVLCSKLRTQQKYANLEVPRKKEAAAKPEDSGIQNHRGSISAVENDKPRLVEEWEMTDQKGYEMKDVDHTGAMNQTQPQLNFNPAPVMPVMSGVMSGGGQFCTKCGAMKTTGFCLRCGGGPALSGTVPSPVFSANVSAVPMVPMGPLTTQALYSPSAPPAQDPALPSYADMLIMQSKADIGSYGYKA